MAKVQLESKDDLLSQIESKSIFRSDLRQAERQGPLSKRFGMLVSLYYSMHNVRSTYYYQQLS
jgi:hypothetical protein